jgi:hypothetical protein
MVPLYIYAHRFWSTNSQCEGIVALDLYYTVLTRDTQISAHVLCQDQIVVGQTNHFDADRGQAFDSTAFLLCAT